MTDQGGQIHIGGNVTGQVAIGEFVYQAQAPGGVINQIVVSDPIRALPRPVDVRPRSRRDQVERTAVLGEATDSLRNEPVQIVARDGWGKTSVIAQLAHRREVEQYRDGIAVISGWGLPVEDVEQAIFDVFYESTLPDTVHRITSGQLRTSLANVEAAIVVDDLDLPRQHVDRLINACGTSGFVSSASTQTMWSGGKAVDLGRMDDADALFLFQERLGTAIEGAELEAVTTFVTHIRGYPMAIVAAASAVRRGVSLIEILPRLVGASDPIATVHEEIAATFTLAETRLLSVLAAVEGNPLPPEAVGRVTGVDDATNLLEGLKRDGIIQAASPRYRLPRASSALLNLPVDGPSTAQGLMQWCDAEADASRITAAGPAIASAIRSAARDDNYSAAMALGRAADDALSLSGRWGVWRQVLEATRDASVAAADRFVEGWALHQLGTLALTEQRHDYALEVLTQAADIRRQIGDQAGLDVTEHNLSFISAPAAVVSPQSPHTQAPSHGGIPWWAWTMIVVGLLAIAGVVGFVVANQSSDPAEVTTIAATNGELVSTADVIEIFDVPTGASVSSEFELINIGQGSLAIDDVRVDGHESITSANSCGTLEPNESCLVTVTFSPAEPGEFDATVIAVHSGTNGDARIPIIGLSIDPPEAFVSVDPINLDFGVVSVGADNARSIDIMNGGDLDINIGAIRVEPGSFVRDQSEAEARNCETLAPGESCSITVRFVAAESGVFQGILFIDHTGENPPFEIPLAGVVPELVEPANLVIEIVETTEAAPVAAIDPLTVDDVSPDVGGFTRVDPLIDLDTVILIDPLTGIDPFAEFESFILIDPLILENPLIETLTLWTVSTTVTIKNSGEETAPAGFVFRFETRDSDAPGSWFPAVKANGTPAEFVLEQALGSGEQVSVPVLLGFDTAVYDLIPDSGDARSFAVLRAEVDSCSQEAAIPSPPCRVVESNENDNLSQEFAVPFIVLRPQID